jgi:hypothetical protein
MRYARRSGQGCRRFGGRIGRRAARLANRPGPESAEQRWIGFVGLDQHPGAAPGSSRRGLGVSRTARRRPPLVATTTCRRTGRPLDRHARLLIVTTVIAAVLLPGCDSQEGILSDEPFRLAVPDNAVLIDEEVDDGSSLIKDGERSVRRSFAPRPPAEPTAVLDALFAEGEATGWVVVDRSPSLVVARKEVEGRQWTGSVAIDGDRVRQLLAGR